MKIELVGINGLKRSGKDTTFRFIQEYHPKAQRVAFADKLKRIGAMALGYTESNIEKDETLIDLMDKCKEKWEIIIYNENSDDRIISGREYLQWLGAHAREVFGDTFWIDQVLPQERWHEYSMGPRDNVWQRYPDAEDLVVVTDVRYPNEAERIKSLGGTVWEIVRPGIESDGHSSEIPLERGLVDLTIENKYDLPYLRERVKSALTTLTGEKHV